MYIRNAIIYCSTLLVAVMIFIHYNGEQNRYQLLSYEKNNGVFVFDNKNALLNYCNGSNCQMVMAKGQLQPQQPVAVINNMPANFPINYPLNNVQLPVSNGSLQSYLGQPSNAIMNNTPMGMQQMVSNNGQMAISLDPNSCIPQTCPPCAGVVASATQKKAAPANDEQQAPGETGAEEATGDSAEAAQAVDDATVSGDDASNG